MIKQAAQIEALNQLIVQRDALDRTIVERHGEGMLQRLKSRREAVGGRKGVLRGMHDENPSLNGEAEALLEGYDAEETEIDRKQSFLESAWETTTNVVTAPFRWIGSLYSNYGGLMWPLTIAGGVALAWYTGLGASWIRDLQHWIGAGPDLNSANVPKAVKDFAPEQTLQNPPGVSSAPAPQPAQLSPSAPPPALPPIDKVQNP